ncbi:FAD dependent oxidoreductase [Basidiobolus meristosporus CBS 931.73]|uniref:FAD dependent oxidoreductase n=1 Tax=Basidiobolus meristosporus CBS 931.73 TaxID=1314790 RepID=A0A1Y1YFD7_9FUNG|nr:FAD dependent oxidoreductase [Basidiobolus meristosporus CBS 931.73]|eukprot:ORX96416.1 FAD dependent oxidoreductase [Basidiobolus meristosporus CBS 931.73]
MSDTANRRKVVICGGGVIGASIAYYLSALDSTNFEICLIERESLACGASGKAGGFLALDWCEGSTTDKLARESFNLHIDLANKLNGGERYGYRRLEALSVAASLSDKGTKESPLPWLNGSVIKSSSILGGQATTAQVHPYYFTHTLWQEAETRGAKLQHGRVEGIKYDSSGNAQGVFVDGTIIAADVVILAMGPWTKFCSNWMPFDIPIDGERAHSIVMVPEKPISGHALFLSLSDGTEPEIYPRPDNRVYMCGEIDKVPLPEDPSDILPDHDACMRLKTRAGILSAALDEAVLEREQACYLPQTWHGPPIIGAVPEINNLYIAAGHSCWGILYAPATGLAMAELLVHGKTTSIDISRFDPARYLRPKTA